MNDFREVTEQVRGTDEPRTDGFLPHGLGAAHVLPHKQQTDPGDQEQPSPATYSLGALSTCLSLGLSFPIYEIKKLDHAASSQTSNF